MTYVYDQGTNALGQTQKGFRTSMSDGSGSASWQYDMLGRVLKESKTITGAPASPYITEYTYNTLGQVLTMKYPDGEVVTTNYNAQNLPQSLSGYIIGATYEAFDQTKTLTFGNNLVTTYTYNPSNLRLSALVTSNNIQNLAYTYDNVGNVKTLTDNLNAQTTTFTYDDLNRLLSASIPSVYAHSWTYNPIGNLLTRNDNNGNVTYQYNDAAHKHAVSQVGSQYFCYDANGNMTKRGASDSACASGGDTLTYDSENRLTSIIVGGNTTTYVYDGDGNRVKKVAGGTTTFYVGNHYEVTNSVATKYYYFGKQRVALRTSAGVTYLHSDHLGSTSATSGASVSAQTYYAYGNIRSTTGTVPTDFGFTGQRRDASAGLMYYGARYYDSALGRFISADSVVPKPGNPQTLNRYAYGYNNPLRYIDPTGHDAPDIINFLGEFSTGAAFEAWYNIAWFIPGHENLQVQAGESEAMTTGRVLGDVIAIGIGIDETIIGGGMLGSGAALCGTAVLCVAGAPDMAAGVVVGSSGIATAGSAIYNGGKNLNNLISMAQRHHIATNKNWLRGSRWSEQFDKLFKRGGLDLDDAINKVDLPQHQGPHPEAYHQWIFKRLNGAIAGLRDKAEIRAALEAELKAIATDLKAHPEWVNNPPVDSIVP